MGKVSLPRDVAEAIETLRKRELSNYGIVGAISGAPRCLSKEEEYAIDIIHKWKEDKGVQYKYDKLLSALVNGFEIEQTPEEKVKEYYNDCGMIQKEVVREVLNLLDMKVDGVNKGI